MLRNVVADFLDNVRKERDFDAPFLALLSAMGFSDVHLTHGTIEKGKDFIAKISGEQWVFQTKKGDLGVGDLNGGIMGQLQAAAMTEQGHPAFDKNLSRRIVLVTTGTVTQPAADQINSFSTDALAKLEYPPVEIWDRNKLIELLLKHGLQGIRSTRLSGVDLAAQGRFFVLYGSVVRKSPELAEIEEHSLSWLDKELPDRERVLIGTIESSILAGKCRDGGLLYDALYCDLAALRMGMFELREATDPSRRAELLTLCESQIDTVVGSASDYIEAVWNIWTAADKKLDGAIHSASIFATYPIHCSRVIEALGLIALGSDVEQARFAASRLIEFVESEPGVSHPISDRYAVSIVTACLALERHGRQDISKSLIEKATVWLCDRVEFGAGIAHIDATVQEEIDQLLGYPFSGLNVESARSNLLASALVDLAAHSTDTKLYTDVVNDLKAVEIYPEYFQPADTSAQFLIDHDEVVHYPGVEFADNLVPDNGLGYAPYGPYEPTTFALFESLGFIGYVSISLLLRDRYFPSLWPKYLN
ncbi:MAG: hypothetical protein GC165_20375 [Armatimonadetes bacterium]|nr:hypothetical protein [Armatimonadota bacterium]